MGVAGNEGPLMDTSKVVFPIVHALHGAPSHDGDALLVEATAGDGTVLRFALPLDNVQHMIAFLLVWVGKIGVNRSIVAQTDAMESQGRLPIPATSIAIGEPNGEEGYLGISVGRAELVFSLPVSAFESLGHSLLMAGTPPNAMIS
jgi:hypothetical protein